jgi:hypothetical protein
MKHSLRGSKQLSHVAPITSWLSCHRSGLRSRRFFGSGGAYSCHHNPHGLGSAWSEDLFENAQVGH